MDRDTAVEGVVRALRRVNFQGSIFGQTIAVRLGLSESDIDALEWLLDTGAATAGRLSEVMGLTSGAVTRVIDRLEQAGYVRRTTDPSDRRRVIVEVVPERVGTIESVLDSLERAAASEVDRYTPEQLAVINDFLGRMADVTEAESARLRTSAEADPEAPSGPSEHAAPLAGLTAARLTFRSGAQEIRLSGDAAPTELYRGRFDGATPKIRVRDGRVLVQYPGIPFDFRKRVATMGLNPGVAWTIELVGGIGRIEADLRAIALQRFDLTGGSERIRLALGEPRGEVTVKLVGGAQAIRVERPASVAARLRISGSSGRVELDGQNLGRQGGEVTLDGRGWAAARDRYVIEVVGGSKSVEVAGR